MITIGDLALEAPSSSRPLEVNADTEVVKDVLSERLRIERFRIEPDRGSLRHPFEVSSKQALLFCFQSQNEIANRAVLFHRQNEPEVRPTIRGALPYFLGASTPEQSAIQRQLLQARRTLQRLLIEIRAAEAELSQRDDRTFNLLRSAVALGLLSESDQVGNDPDHGRDLLEQILHYESESVDTTLSTEAVARQAELLEEGRGIRRQLREVDDRIALMTRLEAEQSDATSELAIQRDRLSALEFMRPRERHAAGHAGTCPLCDQGLPQSDETIESLQALLSDLDTRLAASRGSAARRESVIDDLKESREHLLTALRKNAADLDAAAIQNQELSEGRERREQVAFLKGRVSQELERGVHVEGGVEELRVAERRARGQVARLEELFEADDPTESLRRAMDGLSELITDYARSLELEGSEHYARLDPGELTVSYRRPGGRVPLARMGSAENWVGYHLAAHLALHHWFVTKDRPVPRFLMLDQPTQAFFPEEVVDATDDEDADWGAVRRQFELLKDVVTSLGGRFQVIVCDHANLADDWFQDAVVDNWRNGVALIPDDWPSKAT
ncbi:Protein of unknown function [Georgenia satyanarayanai]|uniref:DUF3732 domain-containing protein n=2 Tax=Georgenia satyanarayanai TaxID=860221 RepID=A0A2Y9ABI9_9MICO|nr:uncharacterized protein DUF3732 [Georgenia satyanarayanai]SSA41954.1 Protein of unknown function [Georgenia satyanarayanai]